MESSRTSAYNQLPDLTRHINTLLAESSRREVETKEMFNQAMSKLDNSRNYALNRLEKEEQLRLKALKRSMPMHYQHLGCSRKISEFPESKLAQKIKRETSMDSCFAPDRSRTGHSKNKYSIDNKLPKNTSQDKKLHKDKPKVIDGLHSMLTRKYSSNFKLTFNIGNTGEDEMVKDNEISYSANNCISDRPCKAVGSFQTSPKNSKNQSKASLKKIKPTEKQIKPSTTREWCKPNKKDSILQPESPTKTYSICGSQTVLHDSNSPEKGYLERFIDRRCHDLDVQTKNKMDNIRFFDKNRLVSLYQQKHNFMKSGKHSPSNIDVRRSRHDQNSKPDTKSKLKTPKPENTMRPTQQTSRRVHETKEVKLFDTDKPTINKASHQKQLSDTQSISRAAARRMSNSPARIASVTKMIDFLSHDKDLSLNRSSLRQQCHQLHRDSRPAHCEDAAVYIDHENLINYKIMKILGDGASSVVHLVADLRDGKKYAMKVIDKRDMSKAKIAGMLDEGQLLETCDHPNIIRLIERFESKSKLYMILEYIGPVSLAQHIEGRKLQKAAIDEDEGMHIFYEIGKGVKYLHERSISHRDLKLHNIIVGQNGTIKIIDLGYALKNIEGRMTDTFCGTPTYLPPEVIARQPYHAIKADIWSFGVCMYRVLCGKFPFMGVSQTNLFYRITKAEYSMPDHLSCQAKDLIASMLQVDPPSRPSIDGILSHDWFNSVTFDSTADI